MTHVWERSGLIQMRARSDASATRTQPRPRVTSRAVTLAATLVVAGIVAVYFWRDNAVVTGVGQQQVRLLQDGSRVVLNTDTRIEVNYDERARRVQLIHGEAWFDVSKRPAWPLSSAWTVRRFRALGTSFIVRHDDTRAFRSLWSKGGSASRPSPGLTRLRRKLRKSDAWATTTHCAKSCAGAGPARSDARHGMGAWASGVRGNATRGCGQGDESVQQDSCGRCGCRGCTAAHRGESFVQATPTNSSGS